MPGPTTEAVNDDVKELRGDLHRVEVNLTAEIGRVSSTLTAEIGQVSKSLTAEIGQVSKSVARLEGEFAAFKWMLGATFGLILSGVAATVWSGGATTAKLEALNGRLDRSEAVINGRLDRLEASINRLVERQESVRRPDPAPR